MEINCYNNMIINHLIKPDSAKASLNVPSLCISLTISHPPTNFPSKYNYG